MADARAQGQGAPWEAHPGGRGGSRPLLGGGLHFNVGSCAILRNERAEGQVLRSSSCCSCCVAQHRLARYFL